MNVRCIAALLWIMLTGNVYASTIPETLPSVQKKLVAAEICVLEIQTTHINPVCGTSKTIEMTRDHALKYIQLARTRISWLEKKVTVNNVMALNNILHGLQSELFQEITYLRDASGYCGEKVKHADKEKPHFMNFLKILS